MIPKQFDNIEITDILALVGNKIQESKTLEYKSELPDGNTEKKKFLAGVAAFANTSGGDIIYGVEEERDSRKRPTGIPKEASGLEDCNVDGEILRLDTLIRSGIQPIPPSIRIGKVGDYLLWQGNIWNRW